MITDEELKIKMNYILETCTSIDLHDKKKILNNIASVTKSALQNQLIIYEPNAIITCIIKLFFYYNETASQNICKWKRRRKCRLAKECYISLLQVYIPEKSKEVLEAVINVIYEDKLWEFETFCFEIMCSLLEYGINASLTIHLMWDRIETLNVNIEDTRKIIRILYELLDVYNWPDTHETVTVIERILNLFYISITSSHATVNVMPYAMFKKGLEVCIINIVKHVSNDHLLIIIQYMCSWVVEKGMTDEIILDFGSTLEYTAYIHKVTLYEKTLTPKIFPLLMEMIASTSKIISLLGNRVTQYLLDREENKMNFDTPKIFFEDIQFDLTIEVPCGFIAAALVCLLMNVQDVTLKQTKHHAEISYHIHATVIAVMSLLCWIHKAKAFYEYVNKVVMERAQWAPHLNPPIQSQYNFAAHHILWNKPDLFFVDWEARYGLWKCFRLHETEEETHDT
ncbi:uncharacterized protein LOC122527139 isoform X1 [Frieseomelitta varia]|uniref:uncharacterized protein LOC122527139 isoform X1 n=1 Tax=Frieseomelitta varia TaxID=561572 RepID=UPI001CB6A01D|nr:uncharacterized protein LOC122527139 isoform X1 [Frieseomelitta varia]